jgi:dihydrolipoamide dehydrogenase
VIHSLDDSAQLPWLEERHVTLVRGRGRLDGERRVLVAGGAGGEELLLATRAVVIATGSGAAMPPIEGLDEVAPWTNREATTLHSVPGSLLVLGGGVVGVEMAQAWATLGSRVTLLEALPRVLAREEEFASEQVAQSLRDLGVDLRLGVKVTRAARRDGEVTLTLEGGETVAGEHLLVCVGRRPLSDGIGLERVGLEGGGTIEVDGQMRVGGRDWLYAVGDVNGVSLLTHMGKYQARVAADVIRGRQASAQIPGPQSPRVVFTEPQVAAVGLTSHGAAEQGLRVRCVDHPTGATAGGSFRGRNAPGTCRLVVDEDRRVLVGATFTGVDVAEWLHAATIAIVGEVPLERLWHAVPPFPTRSEVWLRLLETYGL